MNKLTGRYVRAVRELHGLTLDELAQILDITPVKLSRIETGSSILDPGIADRFCAELHINPNRVDGASVAGGAS